ncbi:MAG: GNAT family N-acetyltransferase [Capsulimonadaceae bacterium]
MKIQSLGYLTDLIFPRFDGEVVDAGAYTVVRTPSNPTFHWGNFLLFEYPPVASDLVQWKAIFAREIGQPVRCSHIAFGWDRPDGALGDIQPFVDAGFRVREDIVLTAKSALEPHHPNPEVSVRPIRTDAEWNHVIDGKTADRDPRFGEAGYRTFKARQIGRYRRMIDAGLGIWFGAFLDDTLAGELGIFVDGDVGRYQSVGTRPEFRRRGICGTLVKHAAEHATREWGVGTLVMVADEHYHAARIYESLGFRPVEKQVGVSWWDRES